jgi:hypothetical protein
VWADDPGFDIDNHLHRETIPAPGSEAELQAFVSDYASEPLNMKIPLWQMSVVEGFADGSIAVVSKMHHVAVDGSTGTDMLAQLVDLTPETRSADAPAKPFDPKPLPNSAELLVGAAVSRAIHPMRQVRAFRRVAGSLLRMGQSVIDGGDEEDGPLARSM